MRVLSLRYRVHFHVKRRFSFVLYLLFCLKCTLSKDLPRKDSFIIYVKDLFKMYTCSKKTFDPKIMDTLSSHFLSQVIGNAKKPFYDRRPQSRIRINTMAHAGFCGACGPCSCKTTPASSAGAGDAAVHFYFAGKPILR